MTEVLIRKLKENETAQALALIWDVFLVFEAPDYTQEGVEEFRKSIHDDGFLSKLCMYGAFLRGQMTGVIATRNEGHHIALLFVAGQYHRQGIGTQLFQAVRTVPMTVNASPYAVPFYRRLGFQAADTEQSVSGLRFTPMEYQKKEP